MQIVLNFNSRARMQGHLVFLITCVPFFGSSIRMFVSISAPCRDQRPSNYLCLEDQNLIEIRIHQKTENAQIIPFIE